MSETHYTIDGVVLDPECYVARNVTLIGDITIGKHSSIYPGSVLRAETFHISIGERTNVQDNCIFHICLFAPTIVGDDVTIGHGAIIHGCTIGDRCIIGMGAVVMDGAQVGHDCIIGAGAVVSKNAVIPANSIVMGLPGKVRRELTQDELDYNVESAASYVAEAQAFTEAGLFWRGSDVPADNPMIRLKKQS